ncbi:MAG: OmpH family outer membrane protein [Acidobacteria bacterium]|nr:OmpH family outer membrane protein [Acidobacteriota bacterium]
MSRLTLPILLAMFLLPPAGVAQAPADSQAAAAASAFPNAKIAWIQLDQVLFTCDEGQAKFGEIQTFVDEKNKENDRLRAELEKLRNQRQVQGAKLTDDALADLDAQIEDKQTTLERFQQDTQKEIESRRLRVTTYIGKRMQAVLEKIAKEKGINAILFFNSSRDAWIDGSLNLSDDVVKYYNQIYPVAAAKAPAAAAPAKKQ